MAYDQETEQMYILNLLKFEKWKAALGIMPISFIYVSPSYLVYWHLGKSNKILRKWESSLTCAANVFQSGCILWSFLTHLWRPNNLTRDSGLFTSPFDSHLYKAEYSIYGNLGVTSGII